MKLCSPACSGVYHVSSCCIRQARRRTAVCLLTAYVFYQIMARKAEPASLLNSPLCVSRRFTAPHLTKLPNRCMFGSNRLNLLTLACCIINNNSISKNTRPGFDSESHLPDFLFKVFRSSFTDILGVVSFSGVVRCHLLHNYGCLQPEFKGSNFVYQYRIITLSGNYQSPTPVYGMNVF